MAKYVCYEVPEPDFDLSFNDDITLAFVDDENMEANLPDHYPNARVDNLEEKVNEIDQVATTANDAAKDALQVATTANDTATDALQLATTADGKADDANELAQSVADELATLGSKTFSVTGFTKQLGGTVTGSLPDIQTPNDGNTLRVNEAAGGLTVDFEFAGITSFNLISLHLRYAGGANHTWKIQVYNYILAQFQTIAENLGTQSDLIWFNLPISSEEQFIDNGNVIVRFFHASPFIASHYLLVDFVSLLSNISVVNAPTTKENVIGLKLTDAPEFANNLLTPLQSDAVQGGVIPVLIATWLSATAKSVLSYITNISSKLYYSIYPQPKAVSETGTFQLSLAHLEVITSVNSAADCICNIPLNDTVAFPIGSFIVLKQAGLGVVTVTALSGVTLTGDPKTQGQYKFVAIWKEAVNTWAVIGGTA